MSSDFIPSESDPHPLLKIKGEERKRFTKRSIIITVVITLLVYVFPSYFFLESLTTQSSYFFLSLFGYHPRLILFEDRLHNLTQFDRFLYNLYDSSRATYPGISIDTAVSRSNYLIIRACTGMQAGALLLGLIWSTPAETHNRIRSSYTIILALFIGNVLRIAAMIAITTILLENFSLPYEIAWNFAHNWMGRPLGFFGTIGFTILVETRDVRILDTITVWIDTFFGSKKKKDKEEN